MAQMRAIVDLPGSLEAPSMARQIVRAVLGGWKLDAAIPTAELAITELVSNAVLHAATPDDSYEMEIVGTQRGARIYLADGSSIRPAIRELSAETPGGLGMRIVERITSGWGAEDHHGGKRVWVDVDAANEWA